MVKIIRKILILIGIFNNFGEIEFGNLKGDDVRIENMKDSILIDDIDSMLKVRIAAKLTDDINSDDKANNRWIMCSIPKVSLENNMYIKQIINSLK